jgi:hypothetical protein
MAYHISTQNESELKIAKQSYKGVKFMKSCSKLQKLPFKTKVAHKTESCQKVAEQLVETPTVSAPFLRKYFQLTMRKFMPACFRSRENCN